MIINADKEEIRRMEVWVEAWVRTASASNCNEAGTATKYADECLKQFDIRFGPGSKDWRIN